MRFIVQLDDGKYVKRSLKGYRLDPVFTDNANDAEVWIDQRAAVAWCEEMNVGAQVIPIDVPVVEQIRPKTKIGKGSKAADETSA